MNLCITVQTPSVSANAARRKFLESAAHSRARGDLTTAPGEDAAASADRRPFALAAASVPDRGAGSVVSSLHAPAGRARRVAPPAIRVGYQAQSSVVGARLVVARSSLVAARSSRVVAQARPIVDPTTPGRLLRPPAMAHRSSAGLPLARSMKDSLCQGSKLERRKQGERA